MKPGIGARTRRGSVMVALWLAVVAVGSGLVWSVISAAGEDFTGGSGAIPAVGPVSRSAQSSSATAPDPSPAAPLVPPPAPASSAPSVAAAPSSAAAAPSARPRATPRPTASAPASPRSRPAGGRSSTSAPRPAAQAQTRTWSGPAGVVTTRCTGAVIELAGASASADGYTIEVKDRGPEKVVVEFEGRGDATVSETKVEARCSGGVPTYRVDTDS